MFVSRSKFICSLPPSPREGSSTEDGGSLPANYVGDKLSRLDILAETANKTLINVEVRIANESNIIKRTLYYWTLMYTLDSGENYNKLRPAIMINILNFNLFPNLEKVHSNYSLYEKGETERLTEDIEIHFIEIKKYQPDNKKLQHRLNKWLAYLSNTVSTEEMEAIAVGEPALQKALKMEKVFLTKTQERMLYESRQKAIQTYDATMEGRWEDGLSEGKSIGLREGKLSVAKSMLQNGIRLEMVSKMTSLSLQELSEIER